MISLPVGQMFCNFTVPSWHEVQDVVKGQTMLGSYKPMHCTARFKLAVIIPYRDREPHLKVLLKHLHPMLQRQQSHFIIVVVELVRQNVEFTII